MNWITQFKKKHIGRNPRFDREQHWAEIGDIGQTYETLSRYWGHWGLQEEFGDIGQILWKLGRFCGHWADIRDIRQKLGTLGRHWEDIGKILGRYFLYHFLYYSCKIGLFSFLMQDKIFRFSYPR